MKKNKTLLVPIIVACCGLVARDATSQVPAESGPPLEVIARNGADRERHLFSVNGKVPMLMVRPNQTVPVTLQFPATAAGTPVTVSPLDGGGISGGGNGTVPPTGRMLFTFSPGAMPGRYRVMVHIPGAEYLLEFYVVDSNNPPFQKRPRGVR